MKLYSYIVGMLAFVLVLFVAAHLWTASASTLSQARAATSAAMVDPSARNPSGAAGSGHDRLVPGGEAHSEERSGPPIDSTINVILATIGIVTLVLTLGTGWFLQQQEHLHKLLDLQQREREASSAYFRARQQCLGQLVMARAELIRNFRDAFSETVDVALRALEMCSYLEALQSTDAAVRQKAFLKLVPFFGPKVREKYPETRMYCRICAMTAEPGNDKWINPFEE